MLWRLNEFLLLLIVLVSLLGAMEIGFLLAQRAARERTEAAKAHVDSLQTAVLGLLALLLGFTFYMALSRFDTRKALVLEEANAIGTTYLRVHFLPLEQRQRAQDLLRAYVPVRREFYAAGIDQTRLVQANDEATRIERQLWELAVAAAAQDPRSVPTGLFIESLNDVIDLQEKRQAALDNHVPETVLYLLLVVSAGAFGYLGFGCGLAQHRRFGSNIVFAVLIILVLATIFDIDRPRRGLIKVPQDSLVRLQATLEHAP